jgi:hypothetical protein
MVLTLSQPSQTECSQPLSQGHPAAANSQHASGGASSLLAIGGGALSSWGVHPLPQDGLSQTGSHYTRARASPAADRLHHSAERPEQAFEDDGEEAEDSEALLGEVSAHALRSCARARPRSLTPLTRPSARYLAGQRHDGQTAQVCPSCRRPAKLEVSAHTVRGPAHAHACEPYHPDTPERALFGRPAT